MLYIRHESVNGGVNNLTVVSDKQGRSASSKNGEKQAKANFNKKYNIKKVLDSINGKKINGKKFAFDGCHKIYIIEDEQDEKKALSNGYEIRPIKEIQKFYRESCSLKFISNWKLNIFYVEQFENARFERVEK